MNSSQATIIAKVLTDAGLGSAVDDDGLPVSDWPIYATSEPDTPDAAITVYSTDGIGTCRDSLTGNVVGLQGLQVRVRASTQKIAYDKAQTIYDYLSKTLYRRGVSLAGRYYVVHSVEQFGNILDLGKESPNSKRNVVVFNAQTYITDRTS